MNLFEYPQNFVDAEKFLLQFKSSADKEVSLDEADISFWADYAFELYLSSVKSESIPQALAHRLSDLKAESAGLRRLFLNSGKSSSDEKFSDKTALRMTATKIIREILPDISRINDTQKLQQKLISLL